jgi:hypothetical protein
LNSSRIVASAISNDGTFAVAIFENEVVEMNARKKYEALGDEDPDSREAPEKNYAEISSRLNAPGTKTYEVFISRDSGASFKKIPTALIDYDIAGIHITDAARGEFFVFQHGVSGISRYQSSTGKFQNYPTGFYAASTAAQSSKGWLFAGTRLMALTPTGIEWRSETTARVHRDIAHIASHSKGKHILVVGHSSPNNDMLSSGDYGESWQHSNSQFEIIEQIVIKDNNSFLLATNADYSQLLEDFEDSSAEPNGVITFQKWKSIDGKSWQNVGAGTQSALKPEPTLEAKISFGEKLDVDIRFSSWDCDESRRNAAMACIGVYGSRLYVSKDGGNAWALLKPSEMLGKDIHHALISEDGQRIAVFTRTSILFSRDGGQTFQTATQTEKTSNKQ